MRKATPHIPMRVIAQQAGGSLATVSRALDTTHGVAAPTQQRIADAMQALQAPRTPAHRGTRPTVLIVHEHAVSPLADPCWSGVVVGIQHEASRQGFDLPVVLTLAELVAPPRRLAAAGTDLILLGDAPLLSQVQPWVPQLRQPGIVRITSAAAALHLTPPLVADRVAADTATGFTQIIDHLVWEGIQAIGYLGPLTGADARAEAVTQALARHRLAPVVQHACQEQADAAYCSAGAVLRTYPTLAALVCATDAIAVGAWHAARECGRQVPDELRLTGYGDGPLVGQLIPGLLTVQVPTVLLGELAVRKLAERRRQPGLPPVLQVVPTTLVVHPPGGVPSGNHTDISRPVT